MGKMSFEFEHKINDIVYHKVEPDGRKGVVIDVVYSAVNDRTTYKVSFGLSEYDTQECTEFEIQKEKPLDI